MEVRASDGQVGVCVGGRGLWARAATTTAAAASSLLRDGGRVAVEPGQHTCNTQENTTFAVTSEVGVVSVSALCCDWMVCTCWTRRSQYRRSSDIFVFRQSGPGHMEKC
ncbi:hypothetical protein INR49_007561 [Caranx melampygus]|nr:hypothetical protein INR49_007561 [Caranx melampygus]